MTMPRKQKGVALLTVMLVVALASILAVGMLESRHNQLRRTNNLMLSDQAQLYALSAEAVAKRLLKDDAQQDSKDQSPTDDLNESWARPLPPYPVPEGQILLHLADLQGRFNVNQLVTGGAVNQTAVAVFQRLLTQQQIPDNLVWPLIDWIDEDSEPVNSEGAEETYYLREKPAYRTANHHLADISELALIRGFTPEIRRKLLPFVAALPPEIGININTAPAEVVAALSPGNDLIAAEAIAGGPGQDAYKSPDELLETPPFAQLQGNEREAIKRLMTVTSNFFDVQAEIRLGDRTRLLGAVIERRGSDTLATTSRDLSRRLTQANTTAPAASSGK